MTRSAFRKAQREAAKRSTAEAVKDDLPYMDDKRQAYFNGYLDGYYNGAKWAAERAKDWDTDTGEQLLAEMTQK